MKRDSIPSGRVRQSAARALLGALVLGLTFGAYPTLVFSYTSGLAGSRHDFTDNGHTSGSLCNPCHAIDSAELEGGSSAGRLWRRATDSGTYPTGDVRFCMDCHDGNPPADIAALTNVNLDPAPIHVGNFSEDQCITCHPHDGGFELVGSCDCRNCHDEDVGHTFVGSESDEDDDPFVFKYFGMGNHPAEIGVLDKHDVVYNTSGDLCTPADNECRKCHGYETLDGVTFPPALVGRDHPEIYETVLYAPDDTVNTYAAGDPIPYAGVPSDYTAYDVFCLACHDGVMRTSDPNYPAAIQQLGGFGVPPVPRRDTNSGQADFSAETPYFADSTFADNDNYWVGNGHGLAAGLEAAHGRSMGLSCLSTPEGSGGSLGCHVPHGGKNYSLLEDSGDKGRGWSDWADVPMTFCMSGTNSANGCHSINLLRTTSQHYNNGDLLDENQFHTARGDFTMLHVDPRYVDLSSDFDQPPPAQEHWVDNSAFDPTPFMETSTPVAFASVLPFFENSDPDLKTGRNYNSPTFGGGSPSAIICLTCHGPHGTSHNYTSFVEGVTNSTTGMVRRDVSTWVGSDPLCGQCHP